MPDSRYWIPNFKRKWDSGFLELNSGFQISGFPIPQAKFARIPESGLHNMCQDRAVMQKSPSG